MAHELSTQCDLVFGFLKCAFTEDRIDVDLKVCTLEGIHTFRNDYKSQMTKCSSWGTQVQPYPSLKKEMTKFMRHKQNITTEFANTPSQPKPKAVVKKYSLVPLTRPNRAKLSQPRRVNIGLTPEATQQSWYPPSERI